MKGTKRKEIHRLKKPDYKDIEISSPDKKLVARDIKNFKFLWPSPELRASF